MLSSAASRVVARAARGGVASAAQTRAASSITMGSDGALNVPNDPIIPFIEGDGTGPDIWRSAQRVLDAAVKKAYGGEKAIAWEEVLAGEKAFRATGEWLPEATLESYRKHLVGIKGPLTTPIGGGFRSLNVALRQGECCVMPRNTPNHSISDADHLGLCSHMCCPATDSISSFLL